MPLLRRLPALLLVLLASAAAGQKLRIGECPDIEPIINFNASAFTGVWYENRKFVNRFPDGQKCVTTRISSNDNGVLVFDTLGYEKLFRPVRMRGFAIQTYGPEIGSFSVGVPISDDTRKPNLNLIDVDYDHYAILYSCENKLNGLSHLEWLWLMSRTPRLSARTVAAIMLRLSHYGIRALDLRPTFQAFCPDNIPGK